MNIQITKKIKRRENAPSMGTSHVCDNGGTSLQTLLKTVSHPFPQKKEVPRLLVAKGKGETIDDPKLDETQNIHSG